ncbi:nucleotidyl transferase AbiEii/AbiGii toxin family protein [Polynucleobacter sp. Nonnen-W13]|uniref:nucleotidyl transferase AbiEii/AbiGii toxin family protein n=1 Tax=Polynucleobacter sp. Nonnen-W13 TaxID=1855625 RepID=UPI001C0B550C|nr:nucleotidyl transferase AbiEii/AbiGii toxin family protein [Polynucleobacter sp. Nonnen-W13]MBU3558384.1 nucleotidyl transferase AbiEii/AbiGii toxin family protein [Polynucleobacter sp. Nonnen-W13]
MFKREHHQKISEVLQRLDSQILRDHECYFGGGTAIALMNGEYRESVDIDFLVSDIHKYRSLRELLTGSNGIAPITLSGRELVLAREIRADQYGIRTIIRAGDAHIKFEIISEGRIVFEKPKSKDQIHGIATLSRLDLIASKLLANVDRWSDDSVFSRDAIDLAMMRISKKELHQAVEKSREAYGDSILASLHKSIDRLLTKEGLLERCMAVMKIFTPKALLWQNLEDLKLRADKQVGVGLAHIELISDDKVNEFLDKDLPEINHVLDHLKGK